MVVQSDIVPEEETADSSVDFNNNEITDAEDALPDVETDERENINFIETEDIPVYTIESVVYKADSESINIKYPRITGLLDNEDEVRLNELIRSEAVLILERYCWDYIDGLGLSIDFEIKLINQEFLSIAYTGWGVASIEGKPGKPVSWFYTTNIELRHVERVRLSNIVFIDERLLDKFRECQFTLVYPANMQGFDYELGLDNLLNRMSIGEAINRLENADSMADGHDTYCYLTDDKLGISVHTAPPFGYHAEYEIELDKIGDIFQLAGFWNNQ